MTDWALFVRHVMYWDMVIGSYVACVANYRSALGRLEVALPVALRDGLGFSGIRQALMSLRVMCSSAVIAQIDGMVLRALYRYPCFARSGSNSFVGRSLSETGRMDGDADYDCEDKAKAQHESAIEETDVDCVVSSASHQRSHPRLLSLFQVETKLPAWLASGFVVFASELKVKVREGFQVWQDMAVPALAVEQ
eukprot:828414-Amphidinium_carterae.1